MDSVNEQTFQEHCWSPWVLADGVASLPGRVEVQPRQLALLEILISSKELAWKTGSGH